MTTWTLPNGEVVDYWPPSEPSDVDQIAARLDAVADRISELKGQTVTKQDPDPFFESLKASVEAEKQRKAAEEAARQAEIDAAVAKALEEERNKNK